MGTEEEEARMLGGDLSLKANLKKPVAETSKSKFRKNREIIEEFFKRNVETMLDNKKIIVDAEERRFEKIITKSCKKELNYEMNPYNWELLKLPNGKMKVIILDDKNEYKDWGKEESELLKPPPDDVVIERQKIIDKLRIKEEFSEVVWKYCTFTKEKYIAKQMNEADTYKKVRKKEFTAIPREIIIPKLVFSEQEMKRCNILR
jgi:hypothetical protein